MILIENYSLKNTTKRTVNNPFKLDFVDNLEHAVSHQNQINTENVEAKNRHTVRLKNPFVGHSEQHSTIESPDKTTRINVDNEMLSPSNQPDQHQWHHQYPPEASSPSLQFDENGDPPLLEGNEIIIRTKEQPLYLSYSDLKI